MIRTFSVVIALVLIVPALVSAQVVTGSYITQPTTVPVVTTTSVPNAPVMLSSTQTQVPVQVGQTGTVILNPIVTVSGSQVPSTVVTSSYPTQMVNAPVVVSSVPQTVTVPTYTTQQSPYLASYTPQTTYTVTSTPTMVSVPTYTQNTVVPTSYQVVRNAPVMVPTQSTIPQTVVMTTQQVPQTMFPQTQFVQSVPYQQPIQVVQGTQVIPSMQTVQQNTVTTPTGQYAVIGTYQPGQGIPVGRPGATVPDVYIR